MGITDRIAEDKIKTAMQDGAFDNLPGEGKPLQLDENPYEPEEWRVAFHLLRNNGFDPPWIENSRQIEADLEALRAAALRAYQSGSISDWKRYTAHFADQIADLNRRIFQYNLQVPNDRFQRPLLDPENELEAVQARNG